MAKIDHKHANRSAPIHPANCQVTGYKCRFMGNDYDTFFYDTLLPFGGKSFPEIFHHITQSVRRITARIVVYFGSLSCGWRHPSGLAPQAPPRLRVHDQSAQIGLPNQRLIFLGVKLNTISCTITLPQDKLRDLPAILSWTCHVLYGGVLFFTAF